MIKQTIQEKTYNHERSKTARAAYKAKQNLIKIQKSN